MGLGLPAGAGVGVTLARWRFPGATCLVVTTFSPCPLTQEWQHRIRRAPHDWGQWGTCPDAPLSRAVAYTTHPAGSSVRQTRVPNTPLSPATSSTAAYLPLLSSPDVVSLVSGGLVVPLGR